MTNFVKNFDVAIMVTRRLQVWGVGALNFLPEKLKRSGGHLDKLPEFKWAHPLLEFEYCYIRGFFL